MKTKKLPSAFEKSGKEKYKYNILTALFSRHTHKKSKGILIHRKVIMSVLHSFAVTSRGIHLTFIILQKLSNPTLFIV